MICAFTSSFSCCLLSAFTEPTVPTGMNMGGWIGPWSVVIVPALALECGSVHANSNWSAGMMIQNALQVKRLSPAKWTAQFCSVVLYLYFNGSFPSDGGWQTAFF